MCVQVHADLVTPRNNNYLEDVYADCCAFVVGGSTSGHPKTDLQPLQIEIAACATVPSMIPEFFTFTAPTFKAIGRAAATSIQSTQEFEYTGSINDPSTGNVFQPSEFPEATNGSAALSNNDPNYRIDYGGNPDNPYNQGNPAHSDGKYGFTYVPSGTRDCWSQRDGGPRWRSNHLPERSIWRLSHAVSPESERAARPSADRVGRISAALSARLVRHYLDRADQRAQRAPQIAVRYSGLISNESSPYTSYSIYAVYNNVGTLTQAEPATCATPSRTRS